MSYDLATSLVATLRRNDEWSLTFSPAKRGDHVALLQARLVGRAAGDDVADQDALGARLEAELAGERRGSAGPA